MRGSPPEVIRRGLGLLVIDDPSRTAALPWLRTARRADVPVVSIHDLGLAPLASDLAIDGSLGARRVDGLGREAAALRLGPSYAILSPGIARLGRLRRRAAGPPRVVVGLGGGEQAAAGLRVARQLRTVLDHHPGLSRARVLLSLGLGLAGRAAPRNLPAGIDIVPPAAFRAALAEATVAVVAGGTTLYEACALGTPVVAVAVVPGQVPTIRRFVRAGLAAAMTRPPATAVGSEAWGRAAAGAAIALLADGPRRRELTRRSRLAIDGAGAARVAAAIEELLRTNERATIARHEKTRTTR